MGYALPSGSLQYGMTADANIVFGANPTRLIIDMATDTESFPDGVMDRPTTTRFRVLVPCLVEISYNVVAIAANNDTGYSARVLMNGTPITWSEAGGTTRSSTSEPTQVKKTFHKIMDANDYLELQVSLLENSTLTVVSVATFMTVNMEALL